MRFTSIFFKKLLIVFSILCLVVYLLARFVLPYAVIQPQRRHVDIDPSLISKNHEILTISMNETAALRGVLFHPENSKPKAIIILVHGIGGAKEHFFPLAAKLIQDGYCAIAMDNRAHGESDGDYVTYGYKEKIDISLIVNDLKEKFPDTKIGVWGSSMGGAIAIQAMEYDDRIEFGIIESTFTNLEQIVYDYQKRFSAGIGFRFLTDYVIASAGVIADFDPKKVSPEESVKNITQPMFIAHGDLDKRISYRYGEQLFKNLAATDKTFELVKGAGHLNVGAVGGVAYYNRVLTFMDRQ